MKYYIYDRCGDLKKTITSKRWPDAARRATKIVRDGEIYDVHLQHCATIQNGEYYGD